MIDRLKAEVRAEIINFRDAHGADACLQYFRSKIFELSRDDDAASEQRLVVLILNALSFDARHHAFPTHEIKKMTELIYGILQKNNIQAGSSRLAFLYSDLHMILSQIAFRDGKVWSSVWQENLAQRLSGGLHLQAQPYHHLAMGNRLLRLGHSRSALESYRELIDLGASGHFLEIGLIGEIRALRFLGDFDGIQAANRRFLEYEQASPELRREMNWENCCVAMFENSDFSKLIAMTGKKGSHALPSFRLEALFWAYAAEQLRWIKSFNSVRSIYKQHDPVEGRDKSLLKIAMGLEYCYDAEIPFSLRLSRVEELLNEVSEVKKIDHQLLCWLGITRWLLRNRSASLAKLTLTEYISLSLKISEGRLKDSLGIAGDLIGESVESAQTRKSI